MSEKILANLREKINELAGKKTASVEIVRNALKEELQLYLLDFIYNHPKYSQWIMYGGSALRIIHGLNRMSIDLDFEICDSVTKEYLESLKKEIELHFRQKHQVKSTFLSIKVSGQRGLLLKFNFGDQLDLNHPSKQIHVKIDLNYFVFKNTLLERHSINKDQFSFIILTYNLSTLMASKLSAIFLRGTRGVGKNIYSEKGRDIYDLLWYMNNKIIPNFDYMRAKNIIIIDAHNFFLQLNGHLKKVNDKNLKDDLYPLFINTSFIKHWLGNWRETYYKLLEDYKIHNIRELEGIMIQENILTESISIIFSYQSKEGEKSLITYNFEEGLLNIFNKDLSIFKKNTLKNKIVFTDNFKKNTQSILIFLAQLFHKKNTQYLKKNKQQIINNIQTKTLRVSTTNLNRRTEIILNKEKLLSSQLEDLLK